MNKKYPGKLFVIDGTDSTGKATQTDLLVQNFQKRGYKTEIVDFPRYQDNIWGYLIGLYLKRKFGDPVKISPCLASILYAMDRFLARKKM
ncbi:MAG: thymidylate kinase, partial [Nanoarchaeota archaeon]